MNKFVFPSLFPKFPTIYGSGLKMAGLIFSDLMYLNAAYMYTIKKILKFNMILLIIPCPSDQTEWTA